ncbi:SIS domain-containing protein [Niallia circulans]|uniref:SIS domain-containing protein n=1 Tax=Niallia circulans TaxID=1397 RepID=UPI000BA67E8B|nr:SIS domain-containing protein [Niallia circulans]NRG31082.1 SIS domain-containing protein [Niallia circulans]PAE13131.1 carbohydrate isomerase [Niallia circulans]
MSEAKNYLEAIQEEMNHLINHISIANLEEAKSCIINAGKKGKRLHLTGIGKPSYVARYSASLLSSTGTPAYFLDGTEAIHGSSGQVVEGDVVIAISNSGETEELKKTIQTLRGNGAIIISITGNLQSSIARLSDFAIFAGVSKEGDALNKPPRASVVAELLVLQTLSVLLQNEIGLDAQTYVKWHPGGTLGQSIK